MSGEQLKKKLFSLGKPISEVAKLIGTSQPNLSKILTTKDIKTGLLERIAKAVNKPVSFFFDEENSHHAIANGISSVAAINSNVVGNAVLEERFKGLQSIIEGKDKIIEDKDKIIEEKERMISILMNK